MTEKQWVEQLCKRLADDRKCFTGGGNVSVRPHHRLTYAHEIFSYSDDPQYSGVSEKINANGFQTDILITDENDDGSWTPRVVIECKLGSVTTHDTLTYSTKANIHKQVHPYLRYGILVGGYGSDAVPGRLLRHGAYFDFIITWAGQGLRGRQKQWQDLTDLLDDEIDASRKLERLLSDTRSRNRPKCSVVHRPLKWVESGK